MTFSSRSVQAAGQPVSELMAEALAHPELISLAAGFVDQETLPVEITARAQQAAFANQDAARASLQYSNPQGLNELRDALLRQSCQWDDSGIPDQVSNENVVTTPGSNQLLYMLANILLDPGDIIICGSPTYFIFIGIVKNVGGETYGVAIDQHGMIPESLDDALSMLKKRGDLARVKAIYLVPYFDNPAGSTLTKERAGEIHEIANRYSEHNKIYVVTDEAYRLLDFNQTAQPSLWAGDRNLNHTIVVGTFSKSYSPGIRVGWGILPPELITPINDVKGNIDFGSPNINQYIMYEVLRNGWLQEHVSKLCDHYQQKQNAMLDALDEHMSTIDHCSWWNPGGGMYVWLTLPEIIDSAFDKPLYQATKQAGAMYVPGHYCFPKQGEPVQHNTIRLSFGQQTPAKIAEGVNCLATAVNSVLSIA